MEFLNLDIRTKGVVKSCPLKRLETKLTPFGWLLKLRGGKSTSYCVWQKKKEKRKFKGVRTVEVFFLRNTCQTYYRKCFLQKQFQMSLKIHDVSYNNKKVYQ